MSPQPIPCEKLTLERSTWPPWCWTSHCLAVGPGTGLLSLILVSFPENQRVGQIGGFLIVLLNTHASWGPPGPTSLGQSWFIFSLTKPKLSLVAWESESLRRVTACRQPLRASANSSFCPPKRCHWSDMFTGRLRSEIPPALVSTRGHCSPGQRGPCGSSQAFFLTPSLWRLSCVLWVSEMLK